MIQNDNLSTNPALDAASSNPPPATPARRKKTMSSAAIAANRRNAQKCTGPRTAEGKFRSSRNALKHGAYARKYVTTLECSDTFQNFTNEVLTALAPTDTIELQLVQTYIESTWQAERLGTALTERLNESIEAVQQQDLPAAAAEQNQPSPFTAARIMARAYEHAFSHGPSYLHLEQLRLRFSNQSARATSRLFQYRNQKRRIETISTTTTTHRQRSMTL